MKLFLGGTCNDSQWRNYMIPKLKIDFFNPVVDDWTVDCQKIEDIEKDTSDFCLYTITPKMTGFYSIAELVDDSNKRPNRTLFCLLCEDEGSTFNEGQRRSFDAIKNLVIQNGVLYFDDLDKVIAFVNSI
jgi:hypothetical protein